jgi:hypothetical protein
MLAVHDPSVATVYWLLREPSLAFLWTHGVAPSKCDLSLAGILTTPLDRSSAYVGCQPRGSTKRKPGSREDLTPEARLPLSGVLGNRASGV